MIKAKDKIEELMIEFREVVRDELRAEGHRSSGRLENTMRIEVKESDTKVEALLWLEDYYVFIEYPMRAGSVPFIRGSGAKFSQLVEGLMKWFKRKGASNPMRATFATINKWMQEGRPTRNSLRFSKNGRRTGFMKHSVKVFSTDLLDNLETIYVEKAEDHFRAVFRSLDQFKLKAS